MAALSVTTSAPIWANGSAFDAVRFHTESPCPAFTSRAAMASPMRPRPIQPMSCDALLLMRGNLRCETGRSVRGDRVTVYVRQRAVGWLAGGLNEGFDQV